MSDIIGLFVAIYVGVGCYFALVLTPVIIKEKEYESDVILPLHFKVGLYLRALILWGPIAIKGLWSDHYHLSEDDD